MNEMSKISVRDISGAKSINQLPLAIYDGNEFESSDIPEITMTIKGLDIANIQVEFDPPRNGAPTWSSFDIDLSAHAIGDWVKVTMVIEPRVRLTSDMLYLSGGDFEAVEHMRRITRAENGKSCAFYVRKPDAPYGYNIAVVSDSVVPTNEDGNIHVIDPKIRNTGDG